MKTKEEILSKIKEIIVDKIGIDEDELIVDANLRNDLSCDSLEIVEIAMELEKEYGVEITGERLIDIYTISDLLNNTYDTLQEKSMTVQPVGKPKPFEQIKPKEEESVKLISAEEILNNHKGRILDINSNGDIQTSFIGLVEIIKEAQKNTIDVTLHTIKKEMFKQIKTHE